MRGRGRRGDRGAGAGRRGRRVRHGPRRALRASRRGSRSRRAPRDAALSRGRLYQEGLLRHYSELADATSLEVIVYQRDNAVFTPATVVALARHPKILGLKDGLGDLDLLQRTISAVRAEGLTDFLYFNGLPTAELTGLAYRGIGVGLYSSAVFCFAPDIALAFHTALRTGDDATANRLLDGFYRPLVELRNEGRGCAVSLVKAGVRLTGLDVGEVRPPLHEPADEHVKRLAGIVEHGRALLAETGGRA